MSLFAAFIRDVVEPLAFTILEWAWSFDTVTAPPLFTLPLRFYAYSATSILLWIYEIFPHWMILTLILLGVLFIVQLLLSLLCFPLSTVCGLIRWLISASYLLFRGLLECLASGIGCVRECVRCVGFGCNRRRRENREERIRQIRQQQLEDREIQALGFDLPPHVRVLPAPPLPEEIPVLEPRPAPRNNRRRTHRSPRRRIL